MLVQRWRAGTCKFDKNCTPSEVFLKEFCHKGRVAILKNASLWLLLWTNLFCKYSGMAASQRQMQRYIQFRNSCILHILLRRHVKEEQIYIDFFKTKVLAKSVSTWNN